MTWEDIRTQRDQLLLDSDWTQLRDVRDKLDAGVWNTYRQELRDITTKFDTPEEVVFPQKP
jgi:hypothetical protein